MKKRLYIIVAVLAVTLFSFQTLKSNTQAPVSVTPDTEEELAPIEYRAEDNSKDFDAYTD